VTAAPDVRDLVGDVQRFGLFSAASIVDRYAEMVDRALAREPLPPLQDEGGPDRRADGAAEVTQAWLGLLETAALQLRDGAALPRPMETLALPPAGAGQGSEASLWVHNTASSPSAEVDLHTTGLVSSRGGRIPSAAVSLVPDRLPGLEPGTSREVCLRVHVPDSQPAGHYHGVVVISAAPGEPMALRLEVRAPGEPGR
jgi:hypothetical protein